MSELISGEPQACHDYSTELAAEGRTSDEVFNALKRVNTVEWTGDAADSLRVRLGSLARFVAAHCNDAERGATTVDDYAHRLGAAQGKAADAIMFANAADKMVDRINQAIENGASVDPDARYTIRVEHDKAVAALTAGQKIKGDAVVDAARKIADTRADLTSAAKKLPTYHPGEASSTSPLTGKTTGAPPPHPPGPVGPRSWAALNPRNTNPSHTVPPTQPSAAGPGAGGAAPPPTLPSATGGGCGGSGGYSGGLNGHAAPPPTVPSTNDNNGNGNGHNGPGGSNGYGFDQPGPRGPLDPPVRPLGLAPDARPYLLPPGGWVDTPGTLPTGTNNGWIPPNSLPGQVIEPPIPPPAPPSTPPAATAPPWRQVPQTTPSTPPANPTPTPAPQPPAASSGVTDGMLKPRGEHTPQTLPDPSSTRLTVPGDPGTTALPGAGQPQPPVDPTTVAPSTPAGPPAPSPSAGSPGANSDGPAGWSSGPATDPAGAADDPHRSDSDLPLAAVAGGGVAVVGGVLGKKATTHIRKSVQRNRIHHRRSYQPGSGRRGDLAANNEIGLRVEAADLQADAGNHTTSQPLPRPTRQPRRRPTPTRPNPQPTPPTQPPKPPTTTPPGQSDPFISPRSNNLPPISPQILDAVEEGKRLKAAAQEATANDPASEPNTPELTPLAVGQFIDTGVRADIDVHNTAGIGIYGANAPAVIRATILEALGMGARIIIPRRDTEELLETTELDRVPNQVQIVPELADALATLEDVLNARPVTTDMNDDNDADRASETLTLLILAHSPTHPSDSKELGQLLLRATGRPITALIAGGGWASGHSFGINNDNYITVTRGASTQHLHGAYAYNYPAHATVGALAQLAPQQTPIPTTTDQTDQPPTNPAPTITDILLPAGTLSQNLDTHDNTEDETDTDAVPDASVRTDEEPETNTSDEDHATAADDELFAPTINTPATTEPSADDNAESDESGSADDPPAPAADNTGEGTLRLNVFGTPRLSWSVPATKPGKPAVVHDIPVHSPRHQEVLVYLAAHPEGVTREKIAADVWASDTPTDRPTNAVNTTFSRLRKLITKKTGGAVTLPLITLSTGRCKLDPDIFQVDYWTHLAAIKERLTTGTAEQRIHTYRKILATYQGEFGEGLIGEWLEAPRQDVLRDVVDVATQLAEILIKNEEPDQALDVLEQARQADKYNEPIYQQIIRLQDNLGRHDAAERTYELLRTTLAEVDTEPLTTTTALIAKATITASDK